MIKWLAGSFALCFASLFSLAAAARVGLGGVQELLLEVPLVLAPTGAVALRLTIEAPDPTGSRALLVHARAEGASDEEPWTRHARATLVLRRHVSDRELELRVGAKLLQCVSS